MLDGEKRTFLNHLLESCHNGKFAERLLAVLVFEEIQEVALMTQNFLTDLSTAIHKASDSVRTVLIKCFKLGINISTQTLETIFFPKSDSRFDKDLNGVFQKENILDPELFDICANAAFQLVGREDNKIASLVHLLYVYVEGIYSFSKNQRNRDIELGKP